MPTYVINRSCSTLKYYYSVKSLFIYLSSALPFIPYWQHFKAIVNDYLSNMRLENMDQEYQRTKKDDKSIIETSREHTQEKSLLST